DGAVARGRRHERALDRPTRITHSPGEGHSLGPPDRFPCWDSPHRGRCVAIVNANVLTAPIFAMTSLAGQPGRAKGAAAEALGPSPVRASHGPNSGVADSPDEAKAAFRAAGERPLSPKKADARRSNSRPSRRLRLISSALLAR